MSKEDPIDLYHLRRNLEALNRGVQRGLEMVKKLEEKEERCINAEEEALSGAPELFNHVLSKIQSAACSRRIYDPVSGKSSGNGGDYYVFGLSGKKDLSAADVLGSTEANQRQVFQLMQKAQQEEFGRKMHFAEIRGILAEMAQSPEIIINEVKP